MTYHQPSNQHDHPTDLVSGTQTYAKGEEGMGDRLQITVYTGMHEILI